MLMDKSRDLEFSFILPNPRQCATSRPSIVLITLYQEDEFNIDLIKRQPILTMNGQKLRMLREFRNYSQEYVAEKLGITQNTYSRIENNQTKITTERLHQVAQVLDVPVSELISTEDPVIFLNGSSLGTQRSFKEEYCKELLENTRHLYEQILCALKEKINFLETELRNMHEEKGRMIELIEKLTLRFQA
jgi:transcriptional regulator with XRE-family HTH domain